MKAMPSIGGQLPALTPQLGWIPTWIVGRRFYETKPAAGDPLAFLREPDNPYDGDAIAVHATRDGKLAGKVGHLPREEAAFLAPLVDRAAIRLSGNLSGADDRSCRSPIRLEVAADVGADTLSGPGGRTAQAIWHAQLFGLWQAREAYAHEALDAYRTAVREVAHSGMLWPETQLFYRLLKGVVADGKAAEARERHATILRAMEEAERRTEARLAEVRAACACAPAGGLLRFGGLRVLPLRALRPAPLLPLGEALRQRKAVIVAVDFQGNRSRLRLLLDAGLPDLLAVRHERLETTRGVLRVRQDQLLAAEVGGAEHGLEVVREDSNPLERPLFLRGCELPDPELPEFPEEATGFAVFVGGGLRRVELFGHPGCAVVARSGLCRLAWHLPVPDDGLTVAAAFALVQRVLAAMVIEGLDPSETPRIVSRPGIEGTLLLRSDHLACLRLRVNEGAGAAIQDRGHF